MRKYYIGMAVGYSIVTVGYIVCTCLYASKVNMACTIIYAICTALWGGLAGFWIHKAVSCKDYEFYRDGYYEKCHELIKVRRDLIDAIELTIEKNNEIIKLKEEQIKEEKHDER